MVDIAVERLQPPHNWHYKPVITQVMKYLYRALNVAKWEQWTIIYHNIKIMLTNRCTTTMRQTIPLLIFKQLYWNIIDRYWHSGKIPPRSKPIKFPTSSEDIERKNVNIVSFSC